MYRQGIVYVIVHVILQHWEEERNINSILYMFMHTENHYMSIVSLH